MRRKLFLGVKIKLFLCIFLLLFSQKTFAQKPSGKALYTTRCAMCHNGAMKEAPRFESLALLPKESIIKALQTGIMKVQGSTLSKAEHKLLAEYISKIDASKSSISQGNCIEKDKSNLH